MSMCGVYMCVLCVYEYVLSVCVGAESVCGRVCMCVCVYSMWGVCMCGVSAWSVCVACVWCAGVCMCVCVHVVYNSVEGMCIACSVYM